MQRSDDIRLREESPLMEFSNGSIRGANFAHSSVIMRTTTQSSNATNPLTSTTVSTITSPAGTNKLNNFSSQINWPPNFVAAAASNNIAMTAGIVLVSSPGESHSSSDAPTPPLQSDPSPDRRTSTYTTSSGRFPSITKNGGFRVTKKMALVVCGLMIIFMVMLLSCHYHTRSTGFIRGDEPEGRHYHGMSGTEPTPRTYPHPRWRPKGAFVSAKAVYESDRVSVEEHSVRLSDTAAYANDAESGADKANVVHNWIWVNQPDQINALVYLGDSKELSTTLLPINAAGGDAPAASKDDPLASYSALSNVPVLGSMTAANNGDFPTLTQWLQRDKEVTASPPERLFLMFRQRKYGYEGHSLAVVGGAVDLVDNGSPLAAAQRELLEELGITDCPTLDTTISNSGGNQNSNKKHGIIHLGGYRSDTNRGGGVVYSFVASRCPLNRNASFVAVPNFKSTTDVANKKRTETKMHTHNNNNINNNKGVAKKKDVIPPKVVMQSADGDLESQAVVIVTQQYLTEGMVNNNNREVGMQGVVKEVKWAATVAIAILRLTGLSM